MGGPQVRGDSLGDRVEMIAVTRALTAAVLLSLCLGSCSFGADDQLRERALNLYSVMDYRGALVLFLRLAEEDPQEGSYWDYAGWCHRYQGDWKSALGCFDRAIPLLPGEEGAWVAVGMGETYLGAADYGKARQFFSEAISRAPEDEELFIRSLRGIAWACAFSGDDQGYEEALKALSELDKELAQAIRDDLSPVLDQVGEEKGTLQDPDKPVEVKPQEGSTPDGAEAEKPEETTKKDSLKEEPVKKAPAKKGPAKEAPKPVEQPKPSSPDPLACDFSTGKSAVQELADLSQRGGASKRSDGVDADGLIYHRITPPQGWPGGGWIPRGPAVSVVMDEFDGKVLRVSVTGSYGVQADPISTGMALFAQSIEGLKPFYGDPAYTKNGGVSMEALWHGSQGRMIRLGVDVMLDGSVKVQLAVTDRILFGRFLIHSQKGK